MTRTRTLLGLLLAAMVATSTGCGSEPAADPQFGPAGGTGGSSPTAGTETGSGGQPLATGGSASPPSGVSTGGTAAAGDASPGAGNPSSGGSLPGPGLSPTGGTASMGGLAGRTGSGAMAGGGTPSSAGTAGTGRQPAGGTAGTGTSSSAGSAGTGTPSTGGSAGTGAPIFHVFLLLGQSNMAGYPKAEAADRVEDARIRVLGYDDCSSTGRQANVWATAAPPLHECWNDAIGPGDYFARALLGVLPASDSIGLVPCAISGEKIETFMKVGGSKYDWIVQRARLAQEAGGVIDGILFHQGESNNGDPNWPGNVSTLVTDLRSDLELGDIPFVAGELLYSGGCAGHNTLVNQLPRVVSNAHVVSAEGLEVDPTDTEWNLHFGHDAQVTLGERYAQQMIRALDW